MRSAIILQTPMILAAASSVISPRSAHSPSRYGAMSRCLRNPCTLCSVQALPVAICVPDLFSRRAICRSGIRRASSALSTRTWCHVRAQRSLRNSESAGVKGLGPTHPRHEPRYRDRHRQDDVAGPRSGPSMSNRWLRPVPRQHSPRAKRSWPRREPTPAQRGL
jgi:hypothetical protein